MPFNRTHTTSRAEHTARRRDLSTLAACAARRVVVLGFDDAAAAVRRGSSYEIVFLYGGGRFQHFFAEVIDTVLLQPEAPLLTACAGQQMLNVWADADRRTVTRAHSKTDAHRCSQSMNIDRAVQTDKGGTRRAGRAKRSGRPAPYYLASFSKKTFVSSSVRARILLVSCTRTTPSFASRQAVGSGGGGRVSDRRWRTIENGPADSGAVVRGAQRGRSVHHVMSL
jgi:hypothetical protein